MADAYNSKTKHTVTTNISITYAQGDAEWDKRPLFVQIDGEKRSIQDLYDLVLRFQADST